MASISSDVSNNQHYDMMTAVGKRKVWKQVVDELSPLCASFMEINAIRNDGASKIRNAAAKEGNDVSLSIMRRLREIVASIDCQLLNFQPANPRNMWASTYCKPILEQPNLFETSIFGFRFAGNHIPLHDHPKMYGFIRTLHGRISIRSYSWLEPRDEAEMCAMEKTKIRQRLIGRPNGLIIRPARYEGELILSAPSENCGAAKVALLEPGRANVHQIKALDDGAAFFDLLLPGYHNEQRMCTYYNFIDGEEEETAIGDIVWLEGTPEPTEHFTMQRMQ